MLPPTFSFKALQNTHDNLLLPLSFLDAIEIVHLHLLVIDVDVALVLAHIDISFFQNTEQRATNINPI